MTKHIYDNINNQFNCLYLQNKANSDYLLGYGFYLLVMIQQFSGVFYCEAVIH